MSSTFEPPRADHCPVCSAALNSRTGRCHVAAHNPTAPTAPPSDDPFGQYLRELVSDPLLREASRPHQASPPTSARRLFWHEFANQNETTGLSGRVIRGYRHWRHKR
jgi:hypothetical protein